MLSDDRLKELLWPHDSVRPIQDELVLSLNGAISKKRHVVVHAPTGLGKTAASLAPAISYAIKNDLKVFFLTPRHTQHKIAIETVKLIEKKYGVSVPVANIIGKKWMCLQSGVEAMRSGDFNDFCRKLKEDGKCSFFSNLKVGSSLSVDSKLALSKVLSTPSSSKLKVICDTHGVCPYEISLLMAKSARVIVTDYYYLFHPVIRDQFLSKIGVSLDNCILIVDEGHNLPDRIKDLASVNVSSRIADLAVKECLKYGFDLPVISKFRDVLLGLSEGFISKGDILDSLGVFNLDDIERVADFVRSMQRRSFVGSVHDFLSSWSDDNQGFARIVTRFNDVVSVSYSCLDPGVVSGPVISQSHSTILMSGTLSPTVMYAELLDFPLNCVEYTFKSPFPDSNRLTMVVPRTSTKYVARSDGMFKLQAKLLSELVDAVPGNSIVFIPSYFLLDKIKFFFESLTSKPVFAESKGLSKQDKEGILSSFSSYKDSGAVLLAVMSGSFAEGVDLPGDLLKAVFVIGLPLAKPDIYSKALIDYYDEKFKRGWDYGYVFPAFNKILQSAGRCIRSESDRGVVVFIDERYAWRSYSRCFPPHWDLVVSNDPVSDIKNFFDSSITNINDL